MFQPAVPIAKVIEGIHNRSYVLPAIQREFVWDTDQIRTLFDSLMRGYPIGAFLFWKVDPATVETYAFYDFITDYHEKDSPYAPKISVLPDKGVTAILDGQQRLTALNIGLYGSHAERIRGAWWKKATSFPKKQLYLDLDPSPDSIEFGMVYNFRFLTSEEATPDPDVEDRWYRVGDVLKLANSGPAIMKELTQRRLTGEGPFEVLYDLYKAIRETNALNAYLVEDQDPDKVLDIFVRVNSGGTELSYSDLLLSMATNQWQKLDAREEVRGLVAELNNTSASFSFTKDNVLKAGLVLIDVPDVGFKISNFTQENMAKMEDAWPGIRSALVTSTDLLASFGYGGRTLSATSVLLPIAYYVHQRQLGPSYVVSSADAEDRLELQRWVARSLMKRGIWGSGLDTLLGRLREAIRRDGASRFPTEAIEAAMGSTGKSLRFDETEIAELLDLSFGSSRVFPVLATLYPGLDLSKSFHEDHIFPKSRFTSARLRKAGIPDEQIEAYLSRVNRLPNLQLLAGLPNVEKQAMLPAEWLHGPHFPMIEKRDAYVQENDLGEVPDEIHGFLDFYEARRTRMEGRLRAALGI